MRELFAHDHTNCTISGNKATYAGGGIYGESSPHIITNCIISGNTSSIGGGIYLHNEDADSQSSITNSTISGNWAHHMPGGGIYCSDSDSFPIILNIISSILWGNFSNSIEENKGDEIYLAFNSGSSINISYSDIDPSLIEGTGTVNLSNSINSNPLFVNPRPASEIPTTLGNYHLQPGSPCIDSGTGEGAPSDDIDGDSRPQGLGYDMGADEYTGNNCQDKDKDGFAIDGGDCGEIDCDDDDEDIHPDADEVCDGVDNDCDDEIDEDLIQGCGTDIGECQSGTQTCSEGGWGECVGEIAPIAELCQDGLDNDCDGVTDEPECNSPPDCTNATPSIDKIWSPNHKMVEIEIENVTDPDEDQINITITRITQDEPVNNRGDGNTFPDADGLGTGTAQVRAERMGIPLYNGEKPYPKNGRIYEISFTADDGQGGTCEGSVEVCVPHDQGNSYQCIDDGQDYNSAEWYEFNVTIDLKADPIKVCFTPDRYLDADPSVTVTLDYGKGTLSNGADTIPPEVSLAVFPVDDPCTGPRSYCVEYTAAYDDSKVEIWIGEDPDNPVISGYVAQEVASFMVDGHDNSATSFCIYNITGGSGSLEDDPCNNDAGGVTVESDALDLDIKGAEDEDGNKLHPTDYDCIPVRITDVDPGSLPPIPNIGITGVNDISLPDGVLIDNGQSLTIILSFDLPDGLTQQEFEHNLQVLYYDEDTGGWESDGISNIVVEWDTPTSGTITFEAAHLTQFAASSKNSGGDDSGGGTQSLSGEGCSVTDHNMSAGSAWANALILLLPLIFIRFRKKTKGK